MIYNHLFGLQLKTGKGEVTMEIELIHKDKERGRVYLDTPGLDEDIHIIDANILKIFYKV